MFSQCRPQRNLSFVFPNYVCMWIRRNQETNFERKSSFLSHDIYQGNKACKLKRSIDSLVIQPWLTCATLSDRREWDACKKCQVKTRRTWTWEGGGGGKSRFSRAFFCISSLRSLHITFLRLIYMYGCRLDSPKVEFTWLLSLGRNNVFCMKTRSLLKQTVNCPLIPIHGPVRTSSLGPRPRVFSPTEWACHRQPSKKLYHAEGSPT